MTTTPRRPGAMTADERMLEIAEILAAAHRRTLSAVETESNPLDSPGFPSAPCEQLVDTSEDTTGKGLHED